MDQRDLLFQDPVVKTRVLHLFGHFTHAGHHSHHAFHATHLDHLIKLHAQVVHVELTFGHTLHHTFGLLGLNGVLGFFDKGYDVAHAKDATGNTFRFERFDGVHFFAKTDELDWLASDGAHRQGSTAAPIAIHPGQDNAGYADLVVKFGGNVHRILTGETINHQQCFAGVGNVAHSSSLRDQFGVNMQTTCSIEHVNIITTKAGLGLGSFGNGNRVFAFDNRQCVDTDLHTKNGQLFHRGRPVGVKRGHQDALAVAILEPFCQLCGGCCFTGTLQADHQDRRWSVVDFQRTRFAFALEDVDQRIMYDLDDLLAGGDRFGHRLTGRLFLNRFDKITSNRERNVRFKQGNTDLA